MLSIAAIYQSRNAKQKNTSLLLSFLPLLHYEDGEHILLTTVCTTPSQPCQPKTTTPANFLRDEILIQNVISLCFSRFSRLGRD